MGAYLKTSSSGNWPSIKKIYVKTSNSGTWSSVKKAYVKVASTGLWKQWFTSTSNTPVNTVLPSISAAVYANTLLSGNQALLGTTLTGSQGTWTTPYGTGTNSYAYSWLNSGVATGSTTTTFSTSGYDYSYISFSVNATDASGTTTAASNSIEVTKNAPANTAASISMLSGHSTSSPYVGDTLVISSNWNTSSTYLPDSYAATFISNTHPSGITTTWLYGSGNPQNSYVVQQGDLGSPIYAYVVAYNSGAPTSTSGISTSVLQTGNVIVAPPTNTSAPYWTDTSNNSVSGPYYVGSTYRLHFGSWSGSPIYYEYYVSFNDRVDTYIASNQSGNFSATYIDITFSSANSATSVVATVWAGNSGGLSTGYSFNGLGTFIYPPPNVNSYPSISGSGYYNSDVYFASGSYTNGSIVETDLVTSSSTSFSSSNATDSVSTFVEYSTVNTSPLPGNGSLQYTVVVPSVSNIFIGVTQVSGGYITSGSYVTGINGNTLTLNQHTGYTTNGGPQSEYVTFNNPYYVVSSNDASFGYYLGTRDTVQGSDGNTYYYYSTSSNGTKYVLAQRLTGTTPTFGSATPTSTGFTFKITNYDSSTSYSLALSPNNGSYSGPDGSGNVTISGFGNGVAIIATVYAAKAGYTTTSASISATSLVAAGPFTYNVSDSTPTPSWSSGAGISISGSTNNVMTISWSSANNTTSYADQVSGTPLNSSLYGRGLNTSDTWAYSSSGNEYGTVYAYNSNCTALISWGASTNAASYYYYYTIGSTVYSGYTTSTSISVSATNGQVVNLSTVIAYTGASGTGQSTYGTAGTTSVTVATKSTSATNGPFYLTYTLPSYTVTFSDSVDSASGSATGSTVTLPTPSAVANYTFNGWYTSSSGGTRVGGGGGSYSPTSNTTLYAQWTYTAPKPSISSVYATGGSPTYITFYAYGTNLGSITGTIYRSSTLTGTYVGSAFTASGTQVGTGNGGASYYYYAVITPWTGASGTGTSGTAITTTKTKASSDSFTEVY